MTHHSLIFISLLAIMPTQARKQAADYVNPFIGASTNIEAAGAYHGLGKTFPGATTPFGMVQVSPNTITGGDNGSGYSYEHQTIEGFAMTQMSGVGWYGDLGNFLVMPTTGKLQIAAGRENKIPGYRSRYDKRTETARPGYYSAKLTDYNILAECSASPHCGFLKFTFPKNAQSRIQIDLARRVGGTSTEQFVEVLDEHTFRGWMKCTPEGGGWGNGDGKANYTLYYYARLNKPMKNYAFWSVNISQKEKRLRENVTSDDFLKRVAHADIIRDQNKLVGKHIGFFTEFETKENEEIELKVGISFVDMDGAYKNFEAEAARMDLEDAQEKAFKDWNKALSCISLEGGTQDEKTIFYTALYHTMIDPRMFADVDGRYVGGDGKTHETNTEFTKRTIFSGWDVFRSQFPLQTLINPRIVNDMIQSLISLADETQKGYYERWEFLNAYSGCMFGNPAISVITDAYAKGIKGFDAEKALEIARKSSDTFGNGPRGYTPGGQSISKTLEYSYTDWCIAELCRLLGKNNLAQTYQQKGENYRNVFDKEKGWFRPRKEDSSWESWPKNARTKEWYGCVECNPYQQGWFVPHNVDGMVELMGGREKVIKDLNNFFEQTPSNFTWNQYYNHANEPVHFVPFLFNRLNKPWLTQKWTRTICEKAYSNRVEGIVGNEDVGQMSAWFVLAASGIHPYCPGSTRMEITSPMFNNITFKTDIHYYKGKRFSIIAHNNSPENRYIQSALLNGKEYNKCFLDFSDIVEGGKLELFMGKEPNEKWGVEN